MFLRSANALESPIPYYPRAVHALRYFLALASVVVITCQCDSWEAGQVEKEGRKLTRNGMHGAPQKFTSKCRHVVCMKGRPVR